MTQQIIERWSQIRGLDQFHAMLELRFLGDILASNKKSPAATEDNAQLESILPQMEPDAYADENQIRLEI